MEKITRLLTSLVEFQEDEEKALNDRELQLVGQAYGLLQSESELHYSEPPTDIAEEVNYVLVLLIDLHDSMLSCSYSN